MENLSVFDFDLVKTVAVDYSHLREKPAGNSESVHKTPGQL